MGRSASDRRRAEILDAVLSVIIDIGFTEMTVADVAKRAGVSTGLVHYHFSSKDELILAAVSAASADDIDRVDRIAGRDASALERIEQLLCDSLPESSTDPYWLLWIETWGEARRSPELAAVMAELDRHESSVIEALIESGRGAGEFTCADPAVTVTRLTALRDGLAIAETLFADTNPPEAAVEVMRVAVHGNLGVGPGPVD